MSRPAFRRAFRGQAIFYRDPQRYYCLAYPCPNLTRWFYLPANSNLCRDCIRKREAEVARERSNTGRRDRSNGQVPGTKTPSSREPQ